ncbi:MAG: proton-conducting transporter membrane subunit, partial [Thermoproteota archaeon]
AITLIIGGLNGLIENDLKRIVAYGTISGLGCIVMVVSLNAPSCIAAGLFLMLSHAFCFGALFLCSGAIIHATGRHDINEMSGLYHRMPITSACCLIGVLSMLTVPLFSEFASKYLVIHSTIYAGATFSTVIALFGCILNVAVGMRLLHSFFVQTKDVTTFSGQIKDPPALMLLPMIIMSAASVIFGIFPAVPLSFLIIPAVKQMGFTVEITSQLAIIETPLGFWSPMIVATAMLALSAVFILMILHFRKGAVAGRNVEREETFQPFLCGEGSNLLDGPHGYHFYHTLTHVLRVEQLCKASNVDRAYNALSAKFLDLCAKLLRLDIRQGYFGAILSFVAGAVVALALSMVFGG